ncbi:MAG: hypothetical protein V4525_02705 [Pseudomonadota bacterium]
MNGILLVTHEGIGSALLQCVTHVYGVCPEGIEICSIQGVDSVTEEVVRAALNRVKAKSSSSTVLVLTDIYGASPSNLAIKLIEPGCVAVLAGVNVPMLLRALTYRNEPLDSLCKKALEGGTRGMVCVPALPCMGT